MAENFDLERIRLESRFDRIQFFASLDSTSDEAIRQIKSSTHSKLPDRPFVVLTAEQTAGRGQRGRAWLSDEGSLTFSVVFDGGLYQRAPARPGSVAPAQLQIRLPLLVGDAVCRSIESVCSGVAAKIKWPNDVLINNKKIAGILVEQIVAEIDQPPLLVIGIGINVNGDSVSDFALPAGSISQSWGQKVDRERLLIDVLRHLNTLMAKTAEASDAGKQNIGIATSRLWRFGEPLTLQLPSGGAISGIHAGLGTQGELILDVNGAQKAIVSGRIVPVGTI